MPEINKLPPEAFLEILRKINGTTLGVCRRVCKYWKNCIDDGDYLWHEVCIKEYKYSSKIAKQKCGIECSWYHIYRNLKKWENISNNEINVREFYKYSQHNKSHALDIDCGVLPLKDARGIVLFDMSTLKYIPVAIPEEGCLKIANNDIVTVFLLKSSLMLERSVTDITHQTDAVFKADKFILKENYLYFFNNRDVYKCGLNNEYLVSELILHCDYDIKEMQVSGSAIYLFTECGKIVTIINETKVTVKPVNCPIEWVKQIKYVSALDDKNFVCYSRNLFKIETNNYQHLYLDFPPITALFFYADSVLIGTRAGEILLYRLSSQKKATKPIFENLAELPEGRFAVQLDVCERKSGPVIVASTFFETYLMEVNFFPYELQEMAKQKFTSSKLLMYKRLLKLRDRLNGQ